MSKKLDKVEELLNEVAKTIGEKYDSFERVERDDFNLSMLVMTMRMLTLTKASAEDIQKAVKEGILIGQVEIKAHEMVHMFDEEGEDEDNKTIN